MPISRCPATPLAAQAQLRRRLLGIVASLLVVAGAAATLAVPVLTRWESPVAVDASHGRTGVETVVVEEPPEANVTAPRRHAVKAMDEVLTVGAPAAESEAGKAIVRLQVRGAFAWRGSLHYQFLDGWRALVAGKVRDFSGPGEFQIRVPSGKVFDWTVRGATADSIWECHGVEPALVAAEERVLVVDWSTLAAQRHRVVDVDAELLAHVAVSVHQLGLPVSAVKLDERGEFVWRGPADPEFVVRTAEGPVSLQPRAVDGVVLLTPARALLGVRFCDADGTVRPTTLRDRSSSVKSSSGAVHAFARSDLPASLVLHDGTAGYAFATASFPSAGLVTLHAHDAIGGGRIVIALDGERRSKADQRILLTRSDGANAHVQMASSTVRFDAIEPGLYDVRWQTAGVPGPWIARSLAIAANAQIELRTRWPTVVSWTGQLVRDGVPSEQPRPDRVRFGIWKSRLHGVWIRLAEDGTFGFELPEGEVPVAPAAVRWVLAVADAVVLHVDAQRRHVIVREPADVTWVDVRANVPAGDEWFVQLHDPADPMLWWGMVQSGNPMRVPVLRGQWLSGVLGVRDEQHRPAAWVQIDNGLREVIVSEAASRRVEVRCELGVPGLNLLAIGPSGQRGGGWPLPVRGVLAVEVPVDTVAFAAVRGSLGQQPEHRVELGSADVVTLR